MLLRLFQRRFRLYVAAGFTVWILTRRRHMPAGHSAADMADDVAQAIADLGRRVDLVVGESYGGMIAQ
jgi:pimeloyl-ACP methyl ester carboxylesterase